VLKHRTSAEWIARLDAEQVPCAPILSREELLTDPQIAANGLIVESTHPHAGAMRQPRPAARFGVTPSELRTFAPLLGEHTDTVLAELGLSPTAIEELHTSKVVA
jgi:crotonobetainyl-CoA:carnitine CoA-transferase CaiB-like acyl-CoA transferase